MNNSVPLERNKKQKRKKKEVQTRGGYSSERWRYDTGTVRRERNVRVRRKQPEEEQTTDGTTPGRTRRTDGRAGARAGRSLDDTAALACAALRLVGVVCAWYGPPY